MHARPGLSLLMCSIAMRNFHRHRRLRSWFIEKYTTATHSLAHSLIIIISSPHNHRAVANGIVISQIEFEQSIG